MAPPLRNVLFVAAVTVALVAVAPAFAVPPVFGAVTVQDRHPAAAINAPKASSVTIYMASKPDRATDGSFLNENIVEIDSLTDAEIQAGRWTYESQLDPGTYYLMLQASPDFDACYIFDAGGYDPACADGYSVVVPLNVPMPQIRYATSATSYMYLKEVTVKLLATPLGVDLPYKVCYLLKSKARHCLVGTVNGYDWNSSATDSLSLRTRGLATKTTFSWFVGSVKVASRTISTR
jgi:hypothetical protein